MTDQIPKRRSTDPVLDAINVLQQSFDKRHTENTGHLEALEEKVDQVLKGFPDGDPASHRKFHEALINRAQAREKFWNDLRSELIRKGILAMLVFLGGLLVAGLAVAVKNLADK